jgi:starch-binding outer membrane protein, SusD/RagB family
MKRMKSRKLIFTAGLLMILFSGCTKLEENVGGNLTSATVAGDTSITSLMKGMYGSLELPFTSYQVVFPLAELSTDEAIAPTRGGDWDDNGSWRVYHQQKWDADNVHIHDCFNNLSGVVFAATDILQYKPTVEQTAEIRFVRAWAMYWQFDFFDQVPYRQPGENVVKAAKVYRGMEALNYIISEALAAEPNLPDGPPSIANKNAAKMLLMKCYLNKGVYQNRANPVFNATDMDTVITLADEIINSNQYHLSVNYFDNFSPSNAQVGKENIFTQASVADGNYQVALAWQAVLSYPQNGFNGFTSLEDFYNKFDSPDIRRGIAYAYPNAPSNPGKRVNTGFLVGQQYDLSTDDSLYSGPVPVNYTFDVQSLLPGPEVQMPGIRPIKYAPDYLNLIFYLGPASNNFVYLRFSDVLFMKAEAILRGGTPTNAGVYGNTALSIINSVRTDPSRGASALSTISLDILIDERGREFWWENWRRQDLIRFGKFLAPFQEKEYSSDPKYLVFPIPNEQIAVNTPNLIQNPGY